MYSKEEAKAQAKYILSEWTTQSINFNLKLLPKAEVKHLVKTLAELIYESDTELEFYVLDGMLMVVNDDYECDHLLKGKNWN